MVVQHARTYRRALLGGTIAAAESYMDGDWDTPDLTALLLTLANNIHVADRLESRMSWLTTPLNQLIHALRRNNVRQAKRNIAAHYDLGNDFYSTFLDQAMLYSSGWFRQPEMTLEQAQQEKCNGCAIGWRLAHRIICWKLAAAGARWRNTPHGNTVAGSPPPPSRANSLNIAVSALPQRV